MMQIVKLRTGELIGLLQCSRCLIIYANTHSVQWSKHKGSCGIMFGESSHHGRHDGPGQPKENHDS
jgi:uncharacterized C2H2 Zn-finger protein